MGWWCVVLFGCGFGVLVVFCFGFLLVFLFDFFVFVFCFVLFCFIVVDMTKLSLCILIGDPQWITTGKFFKIDFPSLSPSLGVT